MTKNLIIFAASAAGIAALLAILDLVLKFPFSGYSLVLDISFLVTAAIILYMTWDTYRENR